MVTSPIKRKDKADTLYTIEQAAVVKISGCGLPSGLTNLRVRYDKSFIKLITLARNCKFE